MTAGFTHRFMPYCFAYSTTSRTNLLLINKLIRARNLSLIHYPCSPFPSPGMRSALDALRTGERRGGSFLESKPTCTHNQACIPSQALFLLSDTTQSLFSFYSLVKPLFNAKDLTRRPHRHNDRHNDHTPEPHTARRSQPQSERIKTTSWMPCSCNCTPCLNPAS